MEIEFSEAGDQTISRKLLLRSQVSKSQAPLLSGSEPVWKM
jgi:hypothetical protein